MWINLMNAFMITWWAIPAIIVVGLVGIFSAAVLEKKNKEKQNDQ